MFREKGTKLQVYSTHDQCWFALDSRPDFGEIECSELLYELSCYWSFYSQLNFSLKKKKDCLQVTETLNPKLFDFMIKKDNFSKVLFYGGSFEPWHEGHMECVHQALASQNWPVIVLPDCNPWKDSSERRSAHALVEEFFKICHELKDLNASVYPGFWAQRKVNPTANWLPQIQVDQKGLLLGDDSFIKIKKWKDFKLVLSCLNKIVVIPRSVSKGDVFNLYEELKKEGFLFELVYLAKHSYQGVSSSLLRTSNEGIKA